MADDEETGELAAHLFAVITARLEDMHEVAVTGQAPDLDRAKILATARQLEENANKIRSMAEAVGALLSTDAA